MKRAAMLVALAAASAFAQDAAIPPGVPAVLESANGRTARVFLQAMDEGAVTFQIYQTDQVMTVGTGQVRRLEFFPPHDAEAPRKDFLAGDQAAVQAALEPLLDPYAPYMAVSNNLQHLSGLLMESYLATADYPKARERAAALMQVGDARLARMARAAAALAAMHEGDHAAAETLAGETGSEAAQLYLRACAERAQGRPKDAVRTVARLVADHGNDLDWLPRGELLAARLYLDLALTNSAALTARQVKNIHAGTHIAAAAAAMHAELAAAGAPAEQGTGGTEE